MRAMNAPLECVWCGATADEIAPMDGADATCHDCWHAMDWHRCCDPEDGPTVCPICDLVLADHSTWPGCGQ